MAGKIIVAAADNRAAGIPAIAAAAEGTPASGEPAGQDDDDGALGPGDILAAMGIGDKPEGGNLKAEKAEGEKPEGGNLKAEKAKGEAALEDDPPDPEAAAAQAEADAEAAAAAAANAELEIPEELKGKIEKRIGKEVRKRKEVEDELATEKAHGAELRKQVKEQSDALQQLQTATIPTNGGLHQVMLADDESAIEAREGQLSDWYGWLLKNSRSPEGVPPDPEGKHEGYTQDELLDRLVEVQRERDLIIPKARRALAAREKSREAMTAAYPGLAKDDSAQRLEIDGLLAKMPALKLLPDIYLVLADSIAGKAMRAARKGKPAVVAGTVGNGSAAGVPARAVPLVKPGTGAPGRITGGPLPDVGFLDAKAIQEGGNSVDALAAALEPMMK